MKHRIPQIYISLATPAPSLSVLILTLFLLALQLLLSSSLSAQEIETTKLRRSSADYRNTIDKTLYATPFLVMIAPESHGMYGAGVGAKYFLDSDTAVDAFVSSTSSGGGQFDSEQWSVRLQKFFGNSFNASLGVGGQNFRWNQVYDSDLNGGRNPYDGPKTKYKSASVGAFGSIGNQWQWDRFTLGANWFSIYVPMALVKSGIERFDSAGDSTSHLRRVGEGKALTSIVFLPTINIGVSFN